MQLLPSLAIPQDEHAVLRPEVCDEVMLLVAVQVGIGQMLGRHAVQLRPLKYTSSQALKSMGPVVGTPISPR